MPRRSLITCVSQYQPTRNNHTDCESYITTHPLVIQPTLRIQVTANSHSYIALHFRIDSFVYDKLCPPPFTYERQPTKSRPFTNISTPTHRTIHAGSHKFNKGRCGLAQTIFPLTPSRPCNNNDMSSA